MRRTGAHRGRTDQTTDLDEPIPRLSAHGEEQTVPPPCGAKAQPWKGVESKSKVRKLQGCGKCYMRQRKLVDWSHVWD